MPTPLMRLLCLLLLLLAPSAFAEDNFRRAAEHFLQTQTRDYPGEVKISLAPTPEIAMHSACRSWQASLPAGVRAWGRFSLAMRCTAGDRRSLYLAAQVSVHGPYLVTARAIRNGARIDAEDLGTAWGELTALPGQALLDPADAIGRHARQALTAGRALQANHLRPLELIRAGEVVQLRTRGKGFIVSNNGKALNAASAGQRVRIRMENGRIINAVAIEAGLAEVQH